MTTFSGAFFGKGRRSVRTFRFSGQARACFLGTMLLLVPLSASALPFRAELNRGNDYYRKGDYARAEQIYSQILRKQSNDQKARFNLGDALYKEGRYAESRTIFESLTGKGVPEKLRQAAYYNLGNSFFRQEDYKSAIGAYEEALKINPKDKDAQFNLELAKKMLMMPRPPKPKEEKNEKGKQEQKNSRQSSGEKPEEREKDKGQDKNRGKDQNQDKKENERTPPGQMSREEALRILNALNEQEQHKAQKIKARWGRAHVKDW